MYVFCLKVVFLAFAIHLTLINSMNLIRGREVPALACFLQTLGITGFIAFQ